MLLSLPPVAGDRFLLSFRCSTSKGVGCRKGIRRPASLGLVRSLGGKSCSCLGMTGCCHGFFDILLFLFGWGFLGTWARRCATLILVARILEEGKEGGQMACEKWQCLFWKCLVSSREGIATHRYSHQRRASTLPARIDPIRMPSWSRPSVDFRTRESESGGFGVPPQSAVALLAAQPQPEWMPMANQRKSRWKKKKKKKKKGVEMQQLIGMMQGRPAANGFEVYPPPSLPPSLATYRFRLRRRLLQ